MQLSIHKFDEAMPGRKESSSSGSGTKGQVGGAARQKGNGMIQVPPGRLKLKKEVKEEADPVPMGPPHAREGREYFCNRSAEGGGVLIGLFFSTSRISLYGVSSFCLYSMRAVLCVYI